jgi:hypothetical protein
MSQQFAEGQLTFSFPDDWPICRPSGTSFYRRHFQSFCGGSKEIDFLAYQPSFKTLWCIEVKDYRTGQRTKQDDLADEVAQKIRDVMAMLPLGGIRDNAVSEPGQTQVREFWRYVRETTNVRVVLHCEIPTSPSKLFPGVKDAANLQTKISQKLRCVDPHALFTNCNTSHGLPWIVT